MCPEWGAGQADARENELVTSDIPALIMTGEYDPIVPPAYGQTAVETLANGYFFEYPGVGHGASAGGDCPLGMMLAFLDDPTTMPDDACMAAMEVAPFAVPTEEVAAVELEPFSNDQLGISGVAPAGWTEAGPGVFVRASSATDVVSLVQQAAPVSAAEHLSGTSARSPAQPVAQGGDLRIAGAGQHPPRCSTLFQRPRQHLGQSLYAGGLEQPSGQAQCLQALEFVLHRVTA